MFQGVQGDDCETTAGVSTLKNIGSAATGRARAIKITHNPGAAASLTSAD
jgi:hypothetical protein